MVNDLTLQNQELISGLKQKPALEELLYGITLQEKLDKVLVILLDCSGSMCGQMETQRKIDVLWKVFKDELMPNMIGWIYGVVRFDDDAYWEILPSQDTQALLNKGTPSLGGSTSMGKGLTISWEWVKRNAHQSRFIMLTDGQPTDVSRSVILERAQVHSNIPIDTVGIGAGTLSYDPLFLAELSRITGGIFCEAGSIRLLAGAIKQLSPAERPLLGMVES